ncbi:MAG: aminoacetone oxidase family FAD-binding enzyme [Candidatus Omnitrophota bacterium]|jgi:hypothetical protein
MQYPIAVIGAGASGIAAAVSLGRGGKSCIICDRMPQIGKKILASGNGRCNLSNEKLDESFYNLSARALVKSIFARFGGEDIKKFFHSLDIILCHDGERLFPATNQSMSVVKALELELRRLSIPVKLNFNVTAIAEIKDGFAVIAGSGEKIFAGSVILAGGGKSYSALGSDGSAYKLAEKFGHSLIAPVPVAVPITVKDNLCHLLQGQKITASARSMIGGKIVSESRGDVLFTKYGLSGTAIMDVSEDISIAINRNGKPVEVSVDMVPFMKEAELEKELCNRAGRGVAAEDLLVGILPNKLSVVFKGSSAKVLKDRRFKVSGTRGWNEAEFTAGGVNVDEINAGTLESKLKKGIYFAGEILDVNGSRGGYNLAWAWASGFVAGLAAGEGK